MTPTSRFEHKYRLSSFEYRAIKSSLAGYVRADRHSALAQDNQYFVRSLYFDTFDYRFYAEKVSGQLNRIKPRIRIYSADKNQTKFVSVELKVREGQKIIKYSTHVAFNNYISFTNNNSWNIDDDILNEFQRIVRLYALEAKVIIDYQREAWIPLDKPTARITFDHNVRSASAKELFPLAPSYRRESTDIVIMEIKTNDDNPKWLRELAKTHETKMEPNSKYSQGVELSCY